jgi:hypothetical protein
MNDHRGREHAMKTMERTIKTVTISCSTFLLVGSMWFRAEDAQAKRHHHRAAASPSPALQSKDPSMTDVGGQQEGSVRPASPTAVSLSASATGMADLGGKQVGPDGKASGVLVSPSAAALPGIEISFKLDPRFTKGMSAEDGWISPPVSMRGGAQGETGPTVGARVNALDAKGQPVDLSPEWIPADPEMVTVSPSQGNEVQITVQHAGQSNLQVTSQKVSKQLSIMAWYQGDAIQVEISEKR